jgi:hypothetical protein
MPEWSGYIGRDLWGSEVESSQSLQRPRQFVLAGSFLFGVG